AGDVRFSIASADLDVAFYHMRVPDGMEEYFMLPPISAKYLAPRGIAVAGVSGESVLLPQEVLQTSLGRAGFSPGDLILDGHCGCQLADDPDSVVGAGHVDNYFVLGGSPKTVGERLRAIADDLTHRGLAVHELEAPSHDCDFFGLSLREGRWLSLRQVIIGFLLRVLTGHIAWALLLLRRELLCILGATYACIEAAVSTAAPLWPTVRHELQLVHDLLPLCAAALGAAWHGRVACTGASPFGLGVVARRAPQDLVGTIGGVAEKWRYKVEGGAHARSRAVGLDLGVSSVPLGDVVADLGDDARVRGDGIDDYSSFADVLGGAHVGPLELQSPGPLGDSDKSILGMRPAVDFDEALVEFMDNEFLIGSAGNQGNVPLAAVVLFLRSFRMRALVLLAKAPRAAAAWSRRARAWPRWLLPRRVASAWAGLLIHDGSHLLALCILVMFASYLRRGEAAKLCARHLVALSEAAGPGYQFFELLLHEGGQEPGRTGVSDESILFDRGPLLTPLQPALKLPITPSEPLWGQEASRLGTLLSLAGRRLSLDRLRPHLCSLRLREASNVMRSQRRLLAETQWRWRWRTTKSLNRYARETKLLDGISWFSPVVMDLRAFVESGLVARVSGRLPGWLATGLVPAAGGGAAGPDDGGPPADAVRRHLQRQYRRAAAPGRALRRRPVLELFCGASAIAKAVLACGLAAFGLDWQRGPLEDHVLPAFVATVVGWIQSRA
ncbi:unnamed protein product, partial [Prorocentrum cordatum]